MKHYIRLNENKHIIRGFSTAFEQPLESDICINEDAGRHFELLGEINPSLKDENGICRFKQYYNKPTLRTDEEKQPELDVIIAEQQRNETLNQLSEIDKDLNRGTEDLIEALLLTGKIIESDLPIQTLDRLNLKKELRLQL